MLSGISTTNTDNSALLDTKLSSLLAQATSSCSLLLTEYTMLCMLKGDARHHPRPTGIMIIGSTGDQTSDSSSHVEQPGTYTTRATHCMEQMPC